MTNRKFILLCIIPILLFAYSNCHGQGSLINRNNALINQGIGKVVMKMENDILIIFQDSHDNYWFGSRSHGAYKYNEHELIQITTVHGLVDNRIINFQEDEQGQIYIQSFNGISRIDDNSVERLTPYDNKARLNQWDLHEDDLWFSGGWDKNLVYRYDGIKLIGLQLPEHPLETKFKLQFKNANYSPYGVYSIYKDRQGAIWFGTSNLGVCRYDGQSLTWISEEGITELDDGPAMGVRSIIEDEDGHFWFCNDMTSRFKIVHNNERSVPYQVTYSVLPGLEMHDSTGMNNYFMSISNDNRGHLWLVSYENGVWRYDGQGFEHIEIKEKDENVRLFSIYKDRQDNLWLGTHTNGPYLYNGATFEPFDP